MKLTDELTYIKGLGPRRAEKLGAVGVHSVADILNLVPRKYITHDYAVPIRDIKEGQHVTIVGKVISAGIQFGRKRRFAVTLSDGTGVVKGMWFNYIGAIKDKIKSGQTISMSGVVGYFSGFQIVHPSTEVFSDSAEITPDSFILPVYSLPEALREINFTSTALQKIVARILDDLSIAEGDDPLPKNLLKKYNYPDLHRAYRETHFPAAQESADHALRRFKYSELLNLQIYLQLKKAFNQTLSLGTAFPKIGENFHALYGALPFKLTAAQERVLKEIRNDMKGYATMNRMVQGDVGSGKTIIALLSMAIAADNGMQSAFMAPTEILAEQHYLSMQKLLKHTTLRVTLLTGSQKAAIKKERLALIANGMVDIVIGTHAVIQKSVQFSELGFIIIDEQHRFGVVQRAQLAEKGRKPDVLVMTATPIPRTMALTVYGDLDISIIDERPAGRKEVKTGWRYDNDEAKVFQFIRDEVAASHQIYYVFPLVDESEKIDLKSATDSFEKMKTSIFPDLRIGLLHGKMPAEEKDRVMNQFKSHELDILVTTTVIEVGVDVANATVMVIEHAERFGLAQLHQLRGRVGRSDLQSYCILKTPKNISSDAGARMTVMCETTDGFKIAEEDLFLRGVGQLFGTKQSGYSDFSVANLMTDQDLLLQARADAEEILHADPKLQKPVHRRLRETVQNELQSKYGYINIA